ncbi:hypothetical protein BHE74_00012017 [Ensete ventricosum]|nr:hypothetical protein BHE74_00012017 [Ensete ventricosum]
MYDRNTRTIDVVLVAYPCRAAVPTYPRGEERPSTIKCEAWRGKNGVFGAEVAHFLLLRRLRNTTPSPASPRGRCLQILRSIHGRRLCRCFRPLPEGSDPKRRHRECSPSFSLPFPFPLLIASSGARHGGRSRRVEWETLYRGKLGLDAAEAQHLMAGLDWQGAIKDIRASVNWLKSTGSSKVLVDNLCLMN